MGMYSVPLFTDHPDVMVDLKRLRALAKRGFSFHFVEPELLADPSSSSSTDTPSVEVKDAMRLGDFLQGCEGKLYAYVTGSMMMAWDAISSCLSAKASLYFHYEEGDIFRIDADPITKRLINGTLETTYGGPGRAEWWITPWAKKTSGAAKLEAEPTPSMHSMVTRGGRGGSASSASEPVAAPSFPLPTAHELRERESHFHTPSVNLKRFYEADQRGQLQWRRVDSDDVNAWMW